MSRYLTEMINVQALYRDYRIITAPSHHKHSRRGWVNIKCPFCTGNPGYHLGYNQTQGFFRCYRCGWQPTNKVISTLTGIHNQEVLKNILRKYWIKGHKDTFKITYATELVYPIGCGTLTSRHKDYLSSRQFDPNTIECEWGLMGTDHKDPDYKFRIIAPVIFKQQDVSFYGRDITNRQPQKYKACAQEKEVIHHKHILYGWDKAQWQTCLIVEGITGVWRFGPGALAVFGSQCHSSQARLIASRYKKAFLCFDNDEAGRIGQDKMDVQLSVLGVETILLDLDRGIDSGEVKQTEADNFMNQEIRR